MADTKLTALTADPAPGLDSLLYTVDDPGGTPASRKTTVAALMTATGLIQATLAADGNQTLAVGTIHVGTIAGYTANRTATLPSAAAVGDRCGIALTDGDDTYQLNMTAAGGHTLNGVAGGTAWGALRVLGEVVICRCVTANSAWVVEYDGRVFVRDTIGGRLTLTSGDPVSGTSTSTATTVLYTPYLHNEISLWNGLEWTARQFTELTNTLTDSTKNPAAATTDAGYDLFVWDDAGVLRLSRGPLWSSVAAGSSARGTGAGTTELELFQGRYVNKVAITNGPAARYGRYVGSFRTNGNAGPNAEDTQAKRYLWNMYNRIERRLFKDAGSSSHTYDSATIRQYNGGTGALEVQAFLGLVEDVVLVTLNMIVQATATGSAPRFGFDLNATTTYVSGSNYNISGIVATIRGAVALSLMPSLGTAIFYANENGNATTANIFDFGRMGGVIRC